MNISLVFLGANDICVVPIIMHDLNEKAGYKGEVSRCPIRKFKQCVNALKTLYTKVLHAISHSTSQHLDLASLGPKIFNSCMYGADTCYYNSAPWLILELRSNVGMGLGSRSTFHTGMQLSQIYSHTPVIKAVMGIARTVEDELATEVITTLTESLSQRWLGLGTRLPHLLPPGLSCGCLVFKSLASL